MSTTLDYILDKFGLEHEFSDRDWKIELANFSRNQLAQLFNELGFQKGAEIGVESGEYSEILLRANPRLALASIDAWKAHREYRDHTRQEKFDKFYENTKARLNRFGVRSFIIKKFSMDALNDFEDRSLDFVYIDGNHKFVEVAKDLHHWAKKVKIGGIVAGHDFTKYKDLEVEIHPAFVVPAFMQAYKLKPLFVIGENVDPVKSWFFVQNLE